MVEDQELLFDKSGLGNHRAEAARTQKAGESSNDMDEKDGDIAHLVIIAKPGIAGD